MAEIHILSFKDGYEKCIVFQNRVETIRKLRNQRLRETDHYLLPDVKVEEELLNKIKEYRQQLRDFMNKLMNEEIECHLFSEDFESKYFPKSPIL